MNFLDVINEARRALSAHMAEFAEIKQRLDILDRRMQAIERKLEGD